MIIEPRFAPLAAKQGPKRETLQQPPELKSCFVTSQDWHPVCARSDN